MKPGTSARVRHVQSGGTLIALAAAGIVAACATRAQEVGEAPEGAVAAAGTTRLLAAVEGFSGPEAVRYDPEQDVYFVGNFNGRGSALDNNGFISRMAPDGKIDQLRFIAGGSGGVTLHAPRGMAIVGDTLWAADVDAVRGFDRRTGAPLATIDFASADVGFLNDVAPGPDGALYITDTGKHRVYRAAGGTFTIALENPTLGGPNGITWDAAGQRFLVVPYMEGDGIFSWQPGGQPGIAGTSAGGRYDGVEVLAPGRVLVASQRDSSLYIIAGASSRAIIRTAGAPADIGVDTKRHRVAVPYIALGRVDIWQLPEQ